MTLALNIVLGLCVVAFALTLFDSRRARKPVAFMRLPYPDEEYVPPPVRQEFDWGD